MITTESASLSKTCIYCGESNPFTNEHVFPAGLGGDDKKFLLKGLVCGKCNTGVFSTLELELMRNSPYGLARLYMQPTGRGKGSKAKPPVLNVDSCEMIDPLTGEISEAEMTVGGVPIVLPQVQISGAAFRLCGSDDNRLTHFLAGLTPLMSETLNVITKVQTEGKSQYEVAELCWTLDAYQLKSTSRALKPPVGIWLARLRDQDDQAPSWPRLFQKSQGQYVLRVAGESDAARLLTQLRKTLPKMVASDMPDPTAIERPSISVSMAMTPQNFFRALAKIGVNLSCYEYGDQAIRAPSFDRIRSIILNASEVVPLTHVPEVEKIFDMDKRPVHVAILFPMTLSGSGIALVFSIRLYGGTVQALRLAEDVRLSADSSPVVFIVHYLENRIERLSIESYIRCLLKSTR